ncbi:MAG: MauE/DoxX family redox-associated membrane protein [Ilumatobacteraceae bacterium]
MAVAAAVAVGVVFLVAAAAKLARPESWRSGAGGLGVPGRLAAVVPWIEVLLGAALVVQFRRGLVAWLAIGLLVAFTALLVATLARGRRPVCACFGSLRARPIGGWTLVRNAALIVLGVVAAVG